MATGAVWALLAPWMGLLPFVLFVVCDGRSVIALLWPDVSELYLCSSSAQAVSCLDVTAWSNINPSPPRRANAT
ncbi:hypothetical protein PM082_003593 [Marasmius tenuissimus]|nr:hypothetical protein PM082_003593 [Marasmius tenuissimus]